MKASELLLLSDDNDIYVKGDVRAWSSEIIELPHGFLAVHVDVDGHTVSFGCFEFYSSTLNGTDDETEYELVFHGYGFAGLQECRHTYWGQANNSGYIFYPKAALIIGALNELRRWFNMNY